MSWLFGPDRRQRAPVIVAFLVLLGALVVRIADPPALARLRDVAFDSYQRIKPRVPDGDRTWLAVGVGYKYSDALKFDAGFVHLWVDDGKINHQTSTLSSLVGNFQSKGNVFGVSAQYLF